jgi:hypothetical protein
VEVPDLGASSVWYLDDHVSVVNEIEVSVILHLRDNVEWSFNVETEVFIEFTLLWLIWIFISIDDIPLLVDFSVLAPCKNVSVLSINTS